MRVGVYYDGSKDGAAQAALSLAGDLRLKRNQVLVRDLTVWRHDSVERFEQVVIFGEGDGPDRVAAAYEGLAQVVRVAASEPAETMPSATHDTPAPAVRRRKS